MNGTPLLKTCSGCNKTLPATTEYFNPNKGGLHGLHSRCRECRRKTGLEWVAANKERVTEYQSQWYQDNREEKLEYSRQWYEENKDVVQDKRRQYYSIHKDKRLENGKRYYQANKEKINEKSRKSYQDNKEIIAQRHRLYWIKNPDKKRAYRHNYLAKKRSLPNDFTAHDWQRATDYFNGCCAVCGRQLKDLFGTHTAAADHWIPLSADDCPGTIPTNIIPLCHGEDGCNNKKIYKRPADWLKQEFSTRKANIILARVETYFAWVLSQQT